MLRSMTTSVSEQLNAVRHSFFWSRRHSFVLYHDYDYESEDKP
jgi:hypothetical protein